MSRYTTMLRWPVEQCEGTATSALADGQQFHKETYKRLGLDDYPIFNESYRPTLNDKIIRRYYFREIGLETLELFRWYMRSKMYEIMPYYNQMYESEIKAKSLDPFTDIDVSRTEEWDVKGTRDDATTDKRDDSTDTTNRTSEKSTTDTSSSQSTSNTGKTDTATSDNGTTSNRNVYSDTPMGLLNNKSDPTVAGLDYATSVTYDDGTTRNSGTTATTTSGSGTTEGTVGVDATASTEFSGKVRQGTTESGTLDSDTTEKGRRGTTERGRNSNMSDMLLKWRSTFVNIDAMILDEVAELFMGVY